MQYRNLKSNGDRNRMRPQLRQHQQRQHQIGPSFIGPPADVPTLPRLITRPVPVRFPAVAISQYQPDDPRCTDYLCGLALHCYTTSESQQITYVVQCDDGEIRHLPLGVLEVITALGRNEDRGAEIDGLQDGPDSAGEGHESSYCLSGDFDDSDLDDLMDMEGQSCATSIPCTVAPPHDMYGQSREYSASAACQGRFECNAHSPPIEPMP